MNNCVCYGKCVEKFSWLTFAAEFLRVHGFAWIKFRSFVYVRTFTISVRLLSASFNVCARARPRRMARKLGHHLIQQYAKANNWTKWIGRQETTYGYLVGTLGIVTWHFTQNIVNCWTLAVHICVCVCLCAQWIIHHVLLVREKKTAKTSGEKTLVGGEAKSNFEPFGTISLVELMLHERVHH